MDRSEAMRSIREDYIEYIQKRIPVDFDNGMQAPVCFSYEGKKHVVCRVIGRFRTQESQPANAYLVNVEGGEVYFLYFQLDDMEPRGHLQSGFWVLNFRILSDSELMALYREDRKMLMNMTFKRVVDFHGHLCPELVLGGKASEYAQRLLMERGKELSTVTIISENCTSALDAIQVLLGATVGNQRLMVMDFGKHNYTFRIGNGPHGFRLSLSRQIFGDEDEFQPLEEKIAGDRATLDEVVHFQELVDDRVRHLLASPPEALFVVDRVDPVGQAAEPTSCYLLCAGCGQQVLRSHAIDDEGKIYCMPCLQQIKTGCIHHRLQ
ncbi:MAG: hypothetical protein C4530_13675 [Desulfobacteraceae bacterium]|nr:MAG: hypothetical protein C4530_13675 [Desulfobacteraceae bacterium]